MRRLIAVILVLAIGAVACGGSGDEGAAALPESNDDTTVTAAAAPPTTSDFIPETPDGRPFLELSLDEKITTFLDAPNTIFAANIASDMGLSGDPRWTSWLLDIVLLGGSSTTGEQGLGALATLSGIARTDDVVTDFTAYGTWMRSSGIDPGEGYEEWKIRFYSWVVDDAYEPLLEGIQDRNVLASIHWGGARRGDIPELNDPERISVEQATFMTDDELVLGVVVDGVAVAYPIRFLGRHELANDHIAGRPVSLVYCTLCRSAILFDRVVGDLVLDFETSGLLLDSNKVMVDTQTDTLWHHLSGTAFAGQLDGTVLDRLPVETTTWSDWVEAHPDTETLDTPPPTIHVDNPERPPLVYDYTPGAAYASYYESSGLLFPVVEPPADYGLKEEVVTVELNGAALAFSATDIADTGLSVLSVGDSTILVVPTSGGARVYDATGMNLEPGSAVDLASSDATEAILGDGSVLPRIVSGQSFWFAWYGLHPDTDIWKPATN